MAGKTFILFLDSFRQLPKLGYLVLNRFVINIEWFLSKCTTYVRMMENLIGMLSNLKLEYHVTY